MGFSWSKPDPWRSIHWGQRDVDLQYIKDFYLDTDTQQIRILFFGPVGVGKSSFINTVHSALQGRIYSQAGVDNTSSKSYTKKYTTYRPRERDSTICYPFVFTDIMGLDPTLGLLVDDVDTTLRGHVKDGYEFKENQKLSEGDVFYNPAPSDNDRVHVLVYVVPADTSEPMNNKVLEKIRAVRLKAKDLEIPQVAIFTKVDLYSPEIKKDLKTVYQDSGLKKKMEQFSADVGLPMSCIFPVRNYHEENATRHDVDSLVLDALRNILNFGRDYLQFKSSSSRENAGPAAGHNLQLALPWNFSGHDHDAQ